MAQSYLQALESELSCPVCLELFAEPHTPKDLPNCDHIICVLCLKQMVKDLRGERLVNCPECRENIEIPRYGVDALKTNRKLRNLAERHVSRDTVQEQRQSSPVTYEKPKVRMCSHKEEKIYLYCTSCNEIMCQECLGQKHKGHQTEEVKNRYTANRNEMQATLSKMKDLIVKRKKSLYKLRELKRQLELSQSEEEARIDQCAQERINSVLEKAQNLKTALENAGFKKEQKINREEILLERQIENAEKEHETALNILHEATEHEFITQYTKQSARLQIVDIESPEGLYIGRAVATFKEEPDNINLGMLVFDDTPNQIKPKFLQDILHLQPTGLVWGLNGQLVVIEYKKRRLTIYEKYQGCYEQFNSWDIQKDADPLGVAVSSNGHVYVTTGKSVHIYSQNGTLLKEFGVPFNTGVCCVSVTSYGNILVGNRYHKFIAVCDPTGTVLTQIQMSTTQNYMTVIRDTHIAVSNGGGKVCVIDIESGRETMNLNVPYANGICYDEKTDSLLVVANRGCDIEQYSCKTGKFVAYLVKGLDNARDVALSADGALAVTQIRQCVRLYQIQYD